MMGETVEVSAQRCVELVLLGLSIADERLQATQQSIREVCAERLATSKWTGVEEMAHWGACTDHALQQVRKATPDRGTIARLAVQITEAHAAAGEDETAREWRTIAAALEEGCEDE